MIRSRSAGSKLFTVVNYSFLTASSLLCLLPFVNLLAVSFSSASQVDAGYVRFWPVQFTISSYEYVLNSQAFTRATFVSFHRLLLGVSVNTLLTVLAAYPLSREKGAFRGRAFYAWFFVLTMLFQYGLIPGYMSVKFTGLIDTIWALVLPRAVPVFNVIVLLNFFRSLPRELEESAYMDGATHWRTLWSIYIPLSKPALATVTLFCIVGHWNAWFDGLIYMNRASNYPLQTYLRTVIVAPEVFLRRLISGGDYQAILQYVGVRTSRAAQLFVATIPVLVAYPFLQKYFTKGLVLGSVKG